MKNKVLVELFFDVLLSSCYVLKKNIFKEKNFFIYNFFNWFLFIFLSNSPLFFIRTLFYKKKVN